MHPSSSYRPSRFPWWPADWRTALARYGAPILLSAVALHQIALAHTSWLSPWKGGGFGMFSTVDSPSARYLRVILHTDIGPVRVAVPEDLRDEVMVLRTLPDPAGLQALADRLASRSWIEHQPMTAEQAYLVLAGPRPPPAPRRVGDAVVRALGDGDTTRGQAVPVQQVSVELWRYHFQPTALDGELLLEATARTAPRDR